MRYIMRPLVALVAAGVLAVSGCSTADEGGKTEAAQKADSALDAADEATPETPTDDDDTTEPPAEKADGSGANLPPSLDASNGQSALLGGKYTYSDGLVVRVSTPRPFHPDRWAAGGEDFKNHVQVRITIFNGTDSLYDPTMLSTSITSGGEPGDEIYDSNSGYSGAPSTSLRPGKKVTFKAAYGVKNPKDLDLEVQPGYPTDPDADFAEWAPVLFVTS